MKMNDSESGPVVPGYHLTECCGCGASSAVWLGTDRKRRSLAIRLTHKKRSGRLLEMERRGVALYRSLNGKHENLMNILDAGETPDYLYSVMEQADNLRGGGQYEPDTLAGKLRREKAADADIMTYLNSVLAGMAYLHDRNIYHGDLKPENLLFVNGILKIGDPGLTADGTVRPSGGTAGFRPPWQATGKECDIYAFGKLIYVLCTNQDPQRFPDIPERCSLKTVMPLNEIALECCEKDARKRFHDADEIRHTMNRICRGRPV